MDLADPSALRARMDLADPSTSEFRPAGAAGVELLLSVPLWHSAPRSSRCGGREGYRMGHPAWVPRSS